MKTRILALLLTVLTILSVVPFAVSAADGEKADIQLIDLIKEANKGNGVPAVVYVSEKVYVSEDTIVPANITIDMLYGGKLIVNAKLDVRGQLIDSTSSNLDISNEGMVIFNTGNHWTYYDKTLPYTYYPVSGPYCSRCGKNTVHWCSVCGTYHCESCTGHSSAVQYCETHKCAKTYCTMCGKFYCPYCEGGYHARMTLDSACTVIPFAADHECDKHHIELYYCHICKSFYCPECAGGYHIPTSDKTCTVFKPASGLFEICPKGHNQVYCEKCNSWYCPTCGGGYHVYNETTKKCEIKKSATADTYCFTHKKAKTYCAHCNTYYCPDCLGAYHVYDTAYKYCRLVPTGSYTPTNWNGNYGYDVQYIYVPGYGYITTAVKCYAPRADIADGTKVDIGARIVLSTVTPGAKIYYTTDGTEPTEKSNLYSAPIVIKDNTTIKAIAVSEKAQKSEVAVYKYTLKSNAIKVGNYTDVAAYKGLGDKLDLLFNKGVLKEDGKFNPDGSVSWADLRDLFIALGVNPSAAKLDEDFFGDSSAITYEEFVVATYKILRADGKKIAVPKKGSSTLKTLKYLDQITSTAYNKAAYCSMLENSMLLGTDFQPKSACTRAYLGWMLGTLCKSLAK